MSVNEELADTPLAMLQAVAIEILHQAQDLLDGPIREDRILEYRSKHLPGSTIGKHLRHANDHFRIMFHSISPKEPRILNYDMRDRDRPMERSVDAAREALRETIDSLREMVPRMHLDDEITLNASTPYPQTLQTSFGRELWYASIHAVHHWSMIRVIATELDIKLHKDFGFAPATLLKRQESDNSKGVITEYHSKL